MMYKITHVVAGNTWAKHQSMAEHKRGFHAWKLNYSNTRPHNDYNIYYKLHFDSYHDFCAYDSALYDDFFNAKYLQTL